MKPEEMAQLGLLGNNIAMQWYVLTHQGSQLPAPAPGGEIAIPGVRASFNTNLLIIGVIVVAAVMVLK